MFVSSFVMVMSAPGTMARFESSTVPLTVPVPVCAQAGCATARVRATIRPARRKCIPLALFVNFKSLIFPLSYSINESFYSDQGRFALRVFVVRLFSCTTHEDAKAQKDLPVQTKRELNDPRLVGL